MLTCYSACLAAILRVPGDYPSIREALEAAATNDEILIADGEYTGPDNRDINVAFPITIRSENGPESCILDAGQMARFFTVTGQVNVQFSGLTFRNGRVNGSYAIYGGAIWSSALPSLIDIDSCVFISNGLYCNGDEHDTSRGGAVSGGNSITNCVFYQNYAESSNYASGGALIGCASVVNCTFYENYLGAEYGHGTQIHACDSVVNCIVYDPTTSPAYQVEHCDEVVSCYFDDPFFAGLDPFDYHLSDLSPCIDAGSDVLLDHDIDGEERPQYARFDIGADEYFDANWTPMPTPTPTGTPTATPIPEPDYVLLMPDRDLETGDILDLSISRYFHGSGHPVDEYVLLEVNGLFFFWPEWSTQLSGDFSKFVPAGESVEQILLFVWPEVNDTLQGLMFHAALFTPGTTTLEAYDAVRWGYY